MRDEALARASERPHNAYSLVSDLSFAAMLASRSGKSVRSLQGSCRFKVQNRSARSFAPIDRTRSTYAFKNMRRDACIPKSSALADSRETSVTSAAWARIGEIAWRVEEHGERKRMCVVYACAYVCVCWDRIVVREEGNGFSPLTSPSFAWPIPTASRRRRPQRHRSPALEICTARADLPSKCEASVRRVYVPVRECVKSALYTDSSAYLGDVVAVVTEQIIARASPCRSASVLTCGWPATVIRAAASTWRTCSAWRSSQHRTTRTWNTHFSAFSTVTEAGRPRHSPKSILWTSSSNRRTFGATAMKMCYGRSGTDTWTRITRCGGSSVRRRLCCVLASSRARRSQLSFRANPKSVDEV